MLEPVSRISELSAVSAAGRSPDFDDVLSAVLQALEREGRLSYAAIRRRHGVDDGFIDDLRAELVDAKRVAFDEAGVVLVWARGSEDTRGDRRPLTVMFCDLVGSTQLSSRLDPERLRRLVCTYQEACGKAIHRFGGHIAQYLGDGLLVYFGYPTAHEDSPARAVHAGLACLEEMKAVSEKLDTQLQIRIGIHTGVVVIGDVGAGGRREQLALGEAPNVAARVQSAAEPGQVLISADTRALLPARFELGSLGARRLKGVSAPLELFRVESCKKARTRLEAVSEGHGTDFVARQDELTAVYDVWGQVRDANGRVVVISGEPGVGKSRLAMEAIQRFVQDGASVIDMRCSPYRQNEALHPFTDAISRVSGVDEAENAKDALVRLETFVSRFQTPDAFSVLAALLQLPSPERDTSVRLGPQELKARGQKVIREWLFERGGPGPICIDIEDLQWADPSTKALLNLVTAEIESRPAMLLITHRPELECSLSGDHVLQLELDRLDETAVEQMVLRLTDSRELPAEVMRTIAERTDGVPLFVEELTRMIVSSGALRPVNHHYELVRSLESLAIPATLHDSLLARIDRLGAAKEIAQVGATIGREFTRDLVHAVCPLQDEALDARLQRLVDTNLVTRSQKGAREYYVFEHALVQDATYQSTLKSRREEYHLKIAETLEAHFEEEVRREPEAIARHYSAAQVPLRAVPYWQSAAEQSMAQSANAEAESRVNQAIKQIELLRQSQVRDRMETAARTTLGYALMNSRGYGDETVESNYRRADELARRLDMRASGDFVGPMLYGLFSFHASRAEYPPATRHAEELLRLGESNLDSMLQVIGHNAMGLQYILQGRLDQGLLHTQRSAELADDMGDEPQFMQYGGDFRGYPRTWMTIAHTLSGDPAQAQRVFEQALARTASHPYTNAFVLCFGVWPLLIGDLDRTQNYAERLEALAGEYGFAMLGAIANVHRAWTRALRDRDASALEAFDGVLSVLRAVKLESFLPLYLLLYAEAQVAVGRLDEARESLDEALRYAISAGGSFCEPELLRVNAKISLASGEPLTTIRRQLDRAEQIALRQGAVWWRLRILSDRMDLEPTRATAEQLGALIETLSSAERTADVRWARELLENAQ